MTYNLSDTQQLAIRARVDAMTVSECNAFTASISDPEAWLTEEEVMMADLCVRKSVTAAHARIAEKRV